MSERRPATTIGELDIHLGFIMDELRDVRARVDGMVSLLATKAELHSEVQSIRKEMHENSLRSFWRRLTEFFVGVTALAAVVGLVVAVAKSLKML